MSEAVRRLPVDPDLERAMVELAPVAVRLRSLEADLVRHGSEERYLTYEHRLVQLGDARRAIAGRAERLSLRPGSLLLFIEQHARLRARLGRKPTLAQLQLSVADALDVRRRDLSARQAEKAEADFRAARAGRDVEDTEGADAYLKACAA